MENKVYLNQKNQPVRILGRGIGSIVTYTSHKTSATGFSNKPRCVWPSSMFEDSKFISRKLIGKSTNWS